jgi:hypothetical protein
MESPLAYLCTVVTSSSVEGFCEACASGHHCGSTTAELGEQVRYSGAEPVVIGGPQSGIGHL